MGKTGEHLFFKLRPIASGYHGRLDNAEKVAEQSRHFGIKRGFTFGQSSIQVKDDQLFHSGISISNSFTAPRG